MNQNVENLSQQSSIYISLLMFGLLYATDYTQKNLS